MSKAEVGSLSEFGPYRTFSNGDLETFNGIYDGKKENVQFFFDANGLRRIGVYLYEGHDLNVARGVWRKAYDSLAKKFGKAETPDIKVASNNEPANSESLSIAASVNVDIAGKTQMAPVGQPKDMFVFSSFWRRGGAAPLISALSPMVSPIPCLC